MVKPIVIGTVLATLLVGGCSMNNSNEASESQNNSETTTVKLTYSNIMDTQTQNELKDLLQQNNVGVEDIEMLIQSIQNYYKSIEDTPLFNEAESLKSEYQIPYNVYELSEVWEKNNPTLIDQNCRITAFRLFKDFIISDSDLEEDEFNTETLEFDLAAIQENPDAKLSDEEVKKFINLFACYSCYGLQRCRAIFRGDKECITR